MNKREGEFAGLLSHTRHGTASDLKNLAVRTDCRRQCPRALRTVGHPLHSIVAVVPAFGATSPTYVENGMNKIKSMEQQTINHDVK